MVERAARVIDVILSDNAIQPRTIRIPASWPIRFVVHNVGSYPHQFAVPAIPELSIDVRPGQTVLETFIFANAGRFEVVSNHDDDQRRGLRGELVVEAPWERRTVAAR